MTKLLELPVIIFVSYIVLLAAGIQEGRYVKHGASNDQHISNEIVNKAIETGDGDVFHCMDINRQPALSHPLLKGHIIQMEPTSYPSELKIKSSSDTIATEAHLPTIACPKGTIPFFDPMGNTGHRGGERAGCTTYDEIYGTQVAINVYEPKVRGQNDLSASWALMVNGPTGNYEGIGAGSISQGQ
uniref:Neprosin activation peptide domain-containing protein n=1 Tax=Oryza meridionalis TaxID=40149 RepID=A0A0E0DBD0_9ORYZ